MRVRGSIRRYNNYDTEFGGVMATEALKRIRVEVMSLTEGAQAELAHDSIARLGEPRDRGV